jgi:hypothetical protein
MASTSESGHDINVANLEDLISCCTGYGAAYNPSKAGLKIAALQTLQTNARNALQAVKVAKTTYDNADNSREIAFKPLKKLCTRILNALESTDAAKQTINDAKTINRKIQGKRADTSKPVIPAATDKNATVAPIEIKQISVSQQSLDSLMDNFAKLIVAVSAEPLYIPNEADLKVTALNATLTNLKTLNTAVINVATPYSNSLITRNATLYQPATGLVDIALEAKKYVKSVFGATSPQYKQISKIQFRRHKI